tara:strand:+ start:74 stop:304 length:231 start_codon:yes stop_codon:yes gene_type:complete
MALSDSVKDSLADATSSLRNALAFAARNEKPHVCKGIAEMIASIDSLVTVDVILDKLDSRQDGDSGKWGPLTDLEE